MKQKSSGKLCMIPVEKILPNPYQPRQMFEESAIDSLAESIKQNGLLQPITVYKENNSYYLIAGERRLRAFGKLGYPQIPAIVNKWDAEQRAVLSLLENLQREDLNCFETAKSIKQMLSQFDMTQEQLSQKLGMAQSTLANKLRLLQLEEGQQQEIILKGLTERHARALLTLPEEKREKALRHIVQNNLNVAQSEQYIASLQKPKAKKGKTLGNIKDIRIFINSLNHAVDMMKKAGIKAETTQNKTEEAIEYKIVIPVK